MNAPLSLQHRILFLCLSAWVASRGSDAEDTVWSLNRCVTAAIQSSPEFIKAQGNREMAKADFRSSLSAVLPRISAATGYTRTDNSPLAGAGSYAGLSSGATGAGLAGLNSDAAYNEYTTSLSVNQNLVDLGTWKDVRRASRGDQAAEWAYRDALADLVLRVKQDYFQVVRLQSSLRVARVSVLQGEQQDSLAQGMARAGSLSRNDLLKVEVRLSQARMQELAAEANLLTARQSLGLLTGTAHAIFADTNVEAPESGPSLPEDSLIALALEENPAYRSAELSLEAAQAGEASARFRDYPTVSGSYSYGYFNTKQVTGLKDWENNDYWSAGVNLNWNLFDGGRARAAAIQARVQTRNAEAAVFQARQSLINDLRQALDELRTAREGLLLADQLLPQAEEDFRLVSRKFELGSASALDLVASQVSYDQAQEQKINVLCDYRVALAKIQRILGKWQDT